jgi:hypothetical protein
VVVLSESDAGKEEAPPVEQKMAAYLILKKCGLNEG